MAILIEGMEMPKSRGEYELRLYVDSDGTATVEGSYCRFEGEPFEAVPIQQHGRLGDLDDFAKRMKSLVEKAENDGFDLGAAWYSAFVRHIELTPAIILASEEGE